MLWFWVVIASQFCNAGATILDKFLLTKRFPRPAVLTFWTAAANLLGLAFVFFNFQFWPGWPVFIMANLAGILFAIAIHIYFIAMKTGEASHISPLTGGVVPIVSLVLSYFFLAERLTSLQIVAVFILALGALLISFEKSQKHNGIHIGMLYAVIAGIFFGAFYVLSRAVFMETNFSTGFVWGRVGCFIAVVPLLLSRQFRRDLFAKTEVSAREERQSMALLAINKILAALYFLGVNFAVSLHSATIVNALSGLQYAILFVLIFIFSKALPRFFKEQFTKMEIFQESLAILLIIGGLALMVF